VRTLGAWAVCAEAPSGHSTNSINTNAGSRRKAIRASTTLRAFIRNERLFFVSRHAGSDIASQRRFCGGDT
jgi:hypothetical protein